MSTRDLYAEYTAAADSWDKRRFDAFLIGWLLNAVGEDEARKALDAAADEVNR